jgi:ABC-type lipoprotein export system ATPase subunit
VSGAQLRAAAVGMDVDGRRLFDDVSFRVASAELLVITGASGSGKTTLAHALAGIVEPDRGEITIAGAPVRTLHGSTDRPALVTQDFGLVPVLTAAESVSLPLQVRALAKDEIRERVSIWLDALGLQSCASRTVAELSGGQRQRVAIARALVKGADVIVMDEPTAELDAVNRAIVLSLIAIELARGAAIVVVSHEAEVIARANVVYELPAPQ